METIYIPRPSVLMKDVEIFSNLSKFSAVTGYVPTTPAPSCDTNSVKQGSRFGNFLRSLRNSVLRPSRGEYDVINDEEYKDTMLSPETRYELSQHKKALVKLVKKHETALQELKEARIQCWKSEAKMKEYKLITETQKVSLMYNQHEKEIRTAALKDMERKLDSWLAVHKIDHDSFETKLLKEMKYREKIQKISADITFDIHGKLDNGIRSLMTHNKQKISDTEISKIADRLYTETCRAYKFGLVENIPCLKEWIEKPQYENSILNGSDIEKKIKHREQILHNQEKDTKVD